MDAVPQDEFAMREQLEEGGEGLARALLEAGVNETMAAQVGTITLKIPKLRQGEPASRTAWSRGGAGSAAP